MMQMQIISSRQRSERGQTIILVAISIVALLAMAALSIDVVTLYAARSETQRAADAAALAGAKAIADSGVTSLDAASPNLLAAQTLAKNMATDVVTALVTADPPINPVAGANPTWTPSVPVVDFSRQGNPLITVNLKRDGLPTFFSKIWGRTGGKVTATATAEVYNPANLPTITPIAPMSVKPWLVANADPTLTAPNFVDTTTWIVDSGVIGKSFDLVSACPFGTLPCVPTPNPPTVLASVPFPQVGYVPAQVTNKTANIRPACIGPSDYERSIECADVNAYAGPSCGTGASVAWDSGVSPGGVAGESAAGAECLIHAASTGLGQGQDLLQDPGPWPAAPFQFKSQSGPQSGKLVTTSNSIVTIPIIDNAAALPLGGGPVTVVGFLQAFINQVDPVSGVTGAPPAGSINITVLNIAGCSSTNNGANPVVGGAGTSPVAVRLITSP
jgi:hypothetical protein